jgi:hypothetical protein
MHIRETGKKRARTGRTVIAGNVIPRAIAAAVRLDREGFDEFEADLEIPGEGWRDAILIGASSSTFRPGEAM